MSDYARKTGLLKEKGIKILKVQIITYCFNRSFYSSSEEHLQFEGQTKDN